MTARSDRTEEHTVRLLRYMWSSETSPYQLPSPVDHDSPVLVTSERQQIMSDRIEKGCALIAGGYVGYAKYGGDYRNGPVRATSDAARTDADDLAQAIAADVKQAQKAKLLQEAQEALVAANLAGYASTLRPTEESVGKCIQWVSRDLYRSHRYRAPTEEMRVALRKLCYLYTAITEE